MQTDTSTMPTVIETEHDGGFPLDSPTESFRNALDRRGNNRKALLTWISENLIEGTDFGRIHVFSRNKCPRGNECRNPRHWSKPSLWKAGAEKICGMLGLIARFPSQEYYEKAAYTGAELRQVIIRCQLVSPSGVVVGEGMGGRSVSQDKGDLNKTIKMAQKSAHVDATLRTAGLSEIFTQDLEGLRPSDLDPDDGSELPQGMSSTRETVGRKMEDVRKQKEERERINSGQIKLIQDILRSNLFSDEERRKAEEFCRDSRTTKDQGARFVGRLKKLYRERKKASDEQNAGNDDTAAAEPDATEPGPDPDEDTAADQEQTDEEDAGNVADEPDATEPGPDPDEDTAADQKEKDSFEDEELEEWEKEVMDNLAIPVGNRAEFLKWAGSQTALSGAALLDDLEENSDMYLTAWEQD